MSSSLKFELFFCRSSLQHVFFHWLKRTEKRGAHRLFPEFFFCVIFFFVGAYSFGFNNLADIFPQLETASSILKTAVPFWHIGHITTTMLSVKLPTGDMIAVFPHRHGGSLVSNSLRCLSGTWPFSMHTKILLQTPEPCRHRPN